MSTNRTISTSYIEGVQSVKNYLKNSSIEVNSTADWPVCTLTFSSGVPTGAPTLSATQMVTSVSSSNPLTGTYSLLLTKSAANAQYQGFVSSEFTIDRQDTAKVFYGSFNYEVVSGTIDLSGTSTQSLEIWIYNTVSGTWTQPAGYRGMNQSSGTGQVVFNFQTDGNTANNSYRIAVITQQTSVTSYVVKFDNFQLGTKPIVLGTPMTDWTSYTPTFTGFGTTSSVEFQWRRVGSDLQIRGKFTSGISTATEARLSLPAGLTSSDTTRIPSIQLAGYGVLNANTTDQKVVLIEPSVTYLTFGTQGTANNGLSKLNGNAFISSTQIMSLNATIPIQGWSSNVQTSSDTDTRVVAALIQASAANQSLTTGTAISWGGGAIFDTHGAYNGTTTYTIPVSGYYELKLAEIYCSGTNYFFVYKNGSALNTTGTIVYFNTATYAGITNGSIIDKFNAGDTVTIVSANSITLNYSATNYRAKWSIQRISGPSVITATETVAAAYYASANGSVSTATPINFDTKWYDTHGAVTTGAAWKFTAPISGKYVISTITGSTTSLYAIVYKNGAIFLEIGVAFAAGQTVPGTVHLNLLAGEYIEIRGNSAQTYLGGSVTGLDTACKIFIARVGN